MMATAYLGIGCNLGDRQANVSRAIQLLTEHKDIDVIRVSALMESPPEGGSSQPTYLNGAIEIKTELSPLELLSQLKTIERRLGRTKGAANAPRPMDLDILFYEDVVIVEGKTLSIPHPRLASREFVLKPLAEIAPDLVHPRLQKSVRELYENWTHESHLAPNGA